MPNYIVNTNAQSNGDHEVHLSPQSQCSSPRYPLPQNQRASGFHGSCHGAVQEAKRIRYATANGCYYCSQPCHTS
jgi:hypothetical protein